MLESFVLFSHDATCSGRRSLLLLVQSDLSCALDVYKHVYTRYVIHHRLHTYMKLLEIPSPPPPTPSNTRPSHRLYDLQNTHDKLMHSFHNRQICSLKGFIVYAHELSCPSRPPSPPPNPLPLVQTKASTPLKAPPSPHRFFDLQDAIDKLMHFLPQLPYFFPLKNGFYSFRAQTD